LKVREEQLAKKLNLKNNSANVVKVIRGGTNSSKKKILKYNSSLVKQSFAFSPYDLSNYPSN